MASEPAQAPQSSPAEQPVQALPEQEVESAVQVGPPLMVRATSARERLFQLEPVDRRRSRSFRWVDENRIICRAADRIGECNLGEVEFLENLNRSLGPSTEEVRLDLHKPPLDGCCNHSSIEFRWREIQELIEGGRPAGFRYAKPFAVRIEHALDVWLQECKGTQHRLV